MQNNKECIWKIVFSIGAHLSTLVHSNVNPVKSK